MNYHEFVEEITCNLKERLSGRNASVEIQKTVKMNDRNRDALIIHEDCYPAAPLLYLDEFYDWYLEGVSVEEIADRMIHVHDFNCANVPADPADFRSFEKARDALTCKLLNTAVNEKYLEDVPCIRFYDLSVVFYCTVIQEPGGHVFSFKVTEELLKAWGKNLQDLYETALSNTARMLGVYLKEIREVFLEMTELSGEEDADVLEEAMEDTCRAPIYILSNTPRRFGAVNMLVYDILKDLSDKLEDDLYIVPSSIHEVLLIPVHSGMKKEEADNMVSDVNRDLLEPEEILSDHVYVYSREKNQIVI